MARPKPTDLVAARALLAARAARRKARERAPKPPDREARQYAADLARLVGEFQAEAMAAILADLEGPATGADGLRTDADPAGVFRQIKRGIKTWLNTRGVGGILDLQFNRVDLQNVQEMGRVLGIDVSGAAVGLGPDIEVWRAQNVDLITRMLSDQLDDMQRVLSANQGRRVEEIRDLIQDRFGVGRSRAALIARDQTLKLNGQITKARQTALGIKRYRWVTSGDGSVRDTHREKNGRIFSWDDPPPDTGHPGQDYQCRCTATPIISDLEDPHLAAIGGAGSVNFTPEPRRRPLPSTLPGLTSLPPAKASGMVRALIRAVEAQAIKPAKRAATPTIAAALQTLTAGEVRLLRRFGEAGGVIKWKGRQPPREIEGLLRRGLVEGAIDSEGYTARLTRRGRSWLDELTAV